MESSSTIDLVLAEKPKCALSAYNIFLLVTRQRILSSKNDAGSASHLPIEPQEIEEVLQQRRSQKGKRAHRKTHGKIGFRALLSKIISRNWKNIQPETSRLLQIYERREMADFKLKKREYQIACDAYEAAASQRGHDCWDESHPSPTDGLEERTGHAGAELDYHRRCTTTGIIQTRGQPIFIRADLVSSQKNAIVSSSSVEFARNYQSSRMSSLFKIFACDGVSSADLLELLDSKTMNDLFAE